MANAPTESKVFAGTLGAGIGAAAASLVVYLIGLIITGQPVLSAVEEQVVASVPQRLVTIINIVVPAVCAYVGGWLAKHTPRPSDDYQPKRVKEDPPVETASPASEKTSAYEPLISDE